MLQYLVILLDDTSVSYCHYSNNRQKRNLISINNLRAGIIFGMKENLMIQFVYPDYELPIEYQEVIESIDHSKIKPSSCSRYADVIVFNNWQEMTTCSLDSNMTYVLRICKDDLLAQASLIQKSLKNVSRLNVVFTDLDAFTEEDIDKYKKCLEVWSSELKQIYLSNGCPQFNLLTDRILLKEMNNCGAGDTSITLAPNGHFYICPAFYLDASIEGTEKTLDEICHKGYDIGSLSLGVDMKNAQLYKLSHAPLCRECDAYQCRRCVWLNRRLTFEVNIPSHQQCILAHLERNAARNLQQQLSDEGLQLGDKISEINYLDPFEVKKEW